MWNDPWVNLCLKIHEWTKWALKQEFVFLSYLKMTKPSLTEYVYIFVQPSELHIVLESDRCYGLWTQMSMKRLEMEPLRRLFMLCSLVSTLFKPFFNFFALLFLSPSYSFSAALKLKLINCLKCHRSFTHPPLVLLVSDSTLSGPSKAPFKDGFFKVHVGWTQLATVVAVETRLTHGQVLEYESERL